jgi:hypothetical protein
VHTPQPSPIGSANGLQGGHAGTWVFSDMSVQYSHCHTLITGFYLLDLPFFPENYILNLLHSKWE